MTPTNQREEYYGVESRDPEKEIRHDGFTPPKTIKPPPPPDPPRKKKKD